MDTETVHQIDKAETRRLLIQQALASRDHVIQTGLAFDGQTFGEYLKAKVRGCQTPELNCYLESTIQKSNQGHHEKA